MSTRTARLIGASVLVACVVAAVASIPVSLSAQRSVAPGQIVIVGDLATPGMQQALDELVARRAAGDALQETTGSFNPLFAVVVGLLVLWIGIGVLIVARQPRNWAGWLFIVTGAPFPFLTLTQALVIYELKADPGSVPLFGLWTTLGEYALYPIALIPLLFLLYPDGHPPSPRWRWAVGGLVGGTALAVAGFIVRPGPYNNWRGDGILYENPVGIEAASSISPVIIAVGTIIALVSALSSVVAVRQRFKRSTGEERQRMRVLALVAALAGTFFALMWLVGLGFELFRAEGDDGDAPIFEVFFALTALTLVAGIPLAYLVAIFRYRLYDLDLVIRKTVQFTVLVVAFMLIGFVIVAAVPALLYGFSADTNVVPTLLVAAVLSGVFLWLRPRATRLANRVVYGKRATPYEVLSEFSERVGETYSTDDVLPRMAQLVAEATGARRADVWLRVGSQLRPEASWPEDGEAPAARALESEAVGTLGDEHTAEVRHHGDLLGAITLEPSPDDPMSPAKEDLVRDLAAQAGLVLRNVALIEDLRGSRKRLVAAQDEERRKLERNIHDGVQQQLVALSVQLRLAEQLTEREPAKARELLADLQLRSNEALEDLRDLARGIYPPLLADQGLEAALQAQARKSPTPVRVEAEGVGRYDQDLEAAVYFSCLEALQNIAKYANAGSASIALAQRNGSLEFRVRDDGVGFDPASVARGSGLQGMTDRIDAIGGSLAIESAPGSGTTVRGKVPCRQRERQG
jgi:signal transduction histidine kinase